MIVASHESINGDYKKIRDMFKHNSCDLNKEERLEYINIYCFIHAIILMNATNCLHKTTLSWWNATENNCKIFSKR